MKFLNSNKSTIIHILVSLQHYYNTHSFETRPGGRSTRDPADPELEPGRVEEKIGKVMNWLTRRPG